MVASIQVIAAGGTAATGAYFLGGATAEYYSEKDGQAYSRWIGQGATALGLRGAVTRQPFERLLGGQHPREAKELVAPVKSRSGGGDRKKQQERGPAVAGQGARSRPRRDRCPGVDLTFSAPKSLSVLWVAADAATRKRIESAVLRAAEQTLVWVEQEVPLARRGKAGMYKELARLVGALFLHTTSRAGEPQLHSHSLLPNLVLRDGKWVGLDTRTLHVWTRALGPVFRANLGQLLVEELGLRLHRPEGKDGGPASWFEVAGVPERLMRAWSTRRRQIEAALDGKSSLGGTSAKARERANLRTRRAKQETNPAALVRGWQDTARQHGFGEQQANALLGQAQRPTLDTAYRTAWQATLQQVVRNEAHFTARQFIQLMCENVQHLGLSGNQVASRALRELERSADIVPLGEVNRERRYTTREMHQIEGQLLSTVDALHRRAGAEVSERNVDRVIRARTAQLRWPGTPPLSAEQAKAVKHVLSQRGSIRVLTGAAGTGKSTTLDAIRQALHKSGYQVIGGALSGAAKEELGRAAKIPSRTVESYLYHLDDSYRGERRRNLVRHHARQLARALRGKATHAPTKVKLTSKHVLVLDEAAMIDTPTLEKLLRQVEKAKATVILCGDARQLQSIGPGGAFQHIAEKVGAARLESNRRQQDARDREAVEDLRFGAAAKALVSYAERGLVTVGKDRSDAIGQLVSTWVEQGGHKNPRDHVIFTQTQAERDLINQRCQDQRHRAGRLLPMLSVKKGTERYYIGDRIIFHRPLRPGIENGYSGRVLAVDPVLRQLTVLLDQRPSREAQQLGARRTVRIPLRKLGDDDISLAYAQTAHKLQGATCRHAYLLTGGAMTHRELAYVQATRAKQTTRIFVDETHAGPKLVDLARAMSQSREKTMARDVVEKRQPGPELELRLDPHAEARRHV